MLQNLQQHKRGTQNQKEHGNLYIVSLCQVKEWKGPHHTKRIVAHATEAVKHNRLSSLYSHGKVYHWGRKHYIHQNIGNFLM